jgi:hypothetical protein
MLYLIFYYLLVSCTCFWAGLVIYSFIQSFNSGKRSIVHFLITGLMVLTATGEWLALFSPVNGITLFFILIILAFISIVRRKKLLYALRSCLIHDRKTVLFQVCLCCFIVMILVLNAGPSMMDDSESYHIQMVKWIQEYGSVPGIANLHLRFGFNSSWFPAIGLFSYPVPDFNTYFSLNGLMGLWFCYLLLEKLFTFISDTSFNKTSNQALGCLVILILCIVNWPMIRGCVTSANYDFITTVCLVVLFTSLFENPMDLSAEWLIWPIFLFTVRMINAPLLLISLFYIFYGKHFSVRRLSIAILTGILFVLPFLVRNFILSGYPFFPVYQVDWFSPDWKADKSQVIEISQYIKYFNRVNPMFQSINETMTLGFPQWIASWYHNLFRFDKCIFTMSILGYAFVLTGIRRFFSSVQRYFLAVMIIQLAVWLFFAPDPRFVQGILLFGIYAAIQKLPIMAVINRKVLKFSTIVFAGLILIYGMSKSIRDINYRNLLVPARLPAPAIQTIAINHIELHLPSKVLSNWNPRCYDVALPCLYRIDPRLETRGSGIANGFRLKPGSLNIPVDGEYKIKP